MEEATASSISIYIFAWYSSNMFKKYRYVIGIIAIIVLAGLVYVCGAKDFFIRQNFSSKAVMPAISSASDHVIPNISTPAGWYLWGGGYSDATGTPVSGITFGNQPINKTGNDTTTLIMINAHTITDANSSPTSTDVEWANLRMVLDSGDSQTSTQLWDVIDNKLMLGEVSFTPAGRYRLTYYLIYGGAEYSFQLLPSPFLPSSAQYNEKNITNSPDAEILREMVKEVAEKI